MTAENAEPGAFLRLRGKNVFHHVPRLAMEIITQLLYAFAGKRLPLAEFRKSGGTYVHTFQ
jgi:hypothetical protein